MFRLSLISAVALAGLMPIGGDRLESEMKEAVASYMLEPGTSVFRNLRRVEREGFQQPLWCGEINAKSIFGTYVGFQGFVAYKDRQGWAVVFDTEAAYRSLARFCSSAP